jgi:hypothetical protein
MMRILQSATHASRPHLDMAALVAQALVRTEPRPVDDGLNRRRWRAIVRAGDRTESPTGTR